MLKLLDYFTVSAVENCGASKSFQSNRRKIREMVRLCENGDITLRK